MHRSRRATRWLAAASVAAAIACPAAAPAPGAATPATAVYLEPAILVRRCTVRTVRRVVHHRHVDRRVRACAWAARGERGTLHLPWRGRAEELGKLVVAGRPVADATITVTRRLDDGWGTARVGTVTTGATGEFTFPLAAPSGVWTFADGDVSGTQKVLADGHVSLFATALRAGRKASLHGDVEGDYIPADGLVIELWFRSGRSRWTPFGQLARARASSGAWSIQLAIPADAAGYTYQIRATVFGSPGWPWTSTASRALTRTVAR